jgi:hypothetical protein
MMVEQWQRGEVVRHREFLVNAQLPGAARNADQRSMAMNAGRSPRRTGSANAVDIAPMTKEFAKQPTHRAQSPRIRVGVAMQPLN